MDAVRGAMPDTECPRCGATAPPAPDQRLATCAACGLVFTPHEVQHPAPRRTPPPAPAPITVTLVGSHLTVTDDGDELIASWPLPRALGVMVAVLALGLAVLAGWVESFTWVSLVVVAIAAVPALLLGYVAFVLLANRTRFAIRPEAVEVTVGPIPLFAKTTVAREGLREVRYRQLQPTRYQPGHYVVEVTPDSSYRTVVRVPTREMARYLRDLLVAGWQLSIEKHTDPR